MCGSECRNGVKDGSLIMLILLVCILCPSFYKEAYNVNVNSLPFIYMYVILC